MSERLPSETHKSVEQNETPASGIKVFGKEALDKVDVLSMRREILDLLAEQDPDKKLQSTYDAVESLVSLSQAGKRLKLPEETRDTMVSAISGVSERNPAALARYLHALSHLRVIKEDDIEKDYKEVLQQHLDKKIADSSESDVQGLAELCINMKKIGMVIPDKAKELIRQNTENECFETILTHDEITAPLDLAKRLVQMQKLGISSHDDYFDQAHNVLRPYIAEYKEKGEWKKYAQLRALHGMYKENENSVKLNIPLTEDLKENLVNHTKVVRREDGIKGVGAYISHLRHIEKVEKNKNEPVEEGDVSQEGTDSVATNSEESPEVSTSDTQEGKEPELIEFHGVKIKAEAKEALEELRANINKSRQESGLETLNFGDWPLPKIGSGSSNELKDIIVNEQGEVVALDLSTQRIHTLQHIVPFFPHLKSINIYGTAVGSLEGMEDLEQLENITIGTHIWDAEIDRIQKIRAQKGWPELNIEKPLKPDNIDDLEWLDDEPESSIEKELSEEEQQLIEFDGILMHPKDVATVHSLDLTIDDDTRKEREKSGKTVLYKALSIGSTDDSFGENINVNEEGYVEVVNLRSIPISSLKDIGQFSQLQELNLIDTNVSSLKGLADLQHLETIYISKDQVPVEDIEEMRQHNINIRHTLELDPLYPVDNNDDTVLPFETGEDIINNINLNNPDEFKEELWTRRLPDELIDSIEHELHMMEFRNYEQDGEYSQFAEYLREPYNRLRLDQLLKAAYHHHEDGGLGNMIESLAQKTEDEFEYDLSILQARNVSVSNKAIKHLEGDYIAAVYDLRALEQLLDKTSLTHDDKQKEIFKKLSHVVGIYRAIADLQGLHDVLIQEKETPGYIKQELDRLLEIEKDESLPSNIREYIISNVEKLQETYAKQLNKKEGLFRRAGNWFINRIPG